MDFKRNYISAAKNRYDGIIKNFYSPQSPEFDYWPEGCCFDSMIDFLNIAISIPADKYTTNKLVPKLEARDFLEFVAHKYITENAHGAWYDDWGWWGTATAKLYDPTYYELLYGNPEDSTLESDFKDICQQCFNFMKFGKSKLEGQPAYSSVNKHLGALNAYTLVTKMVNNQINPTTDWKAIEKKALPYFKYGCWQGDMRPDQTPVDLPDGRKATNLGPYQDTVINALYFEIIQRVLPGGLSTETDIDNMEAFFHNWMNSPELTEKQKLFNEFSTTSGLIRERVSIFADGKAVHGYKPKLAWTGDQGLMLCALTQRYKSTKSQDPKSKEILATITSIINGVFNYSVGPLGESEELIILPWSNQDAKNKLGDAPGNDPEDYFAGTGVFMRGLLEACSIKEVLDVVKQSDHINKILKDTAEICKTPNSYVDAILGGGDLNISHQIFSPFTELAVLTMAHVIFEA